MLEISGLPKSRTVEPDRRRVADIDDGYTRLSLTSCWEAIAKTEFNRSPAERYAA